MAKLPTLYDMGAGGDRHNQSIGSINSPLLPLHFGLGSFFPSPHWQLLAADYSSQPAVGWGWGGDRTYLGFASGHFCSLSSLTAPPLVTTTANNFQQVIFKIMKGSRGGVKGMLSLGTEVIDGWLCLIKSGVYSCLILESTPSMLTGLKSSPKGLQEKCWVTHFQTFLNPKVCYL